MNRRRGTTVDRSLAAGLLVLLLLGGSTRADLAAAGQRAPVPSRWYVYRDGGSADNHGQWTFYLIDPTIPPDRVARTINRVLVPTLVSRPGPRDGATCARFDIQLQGEFQWVGIAVTGPAYRFGRPGVSFERDGAFDLTGARRLVFWARGERGDEYIQIKAAVFGDVPNGDSARLPAATTWLPLTKAWSRYALDVSTMNLTRVVSLFAFVVDRAHNPGGTLTFYLGDIYFEMDGAK